MFRQSAQGCKMQSRHHIFANSTNHPDRLMLIMYKNSENLHCLKIEATEKVDRWELDNGAESGVNCGWSTSHLSVITESRAQNQYRCNISRQ